MLLRTHIVISFFAMLLFFSNFEHKILLVLFTFIGTALPDIDTEFSFLGRTKLAWLLRLFTKHRGIFHSFTLLILLTACLIFFVPVLAFPLFLGYSLHLFVDSFTIQGIIPFYPWKEEVAGKVKTGGMIDTGIFIFFALADAVVLFFVGYSMMGFK